MPRFHFAAVCPNNYSFAYQNGKRCCVYSFDKNGANITIDSASCYNDDFIACPGEICRSGILATNM